jgi:EAL domain-containing protein (putative c-di-GMP-specific phosphodiesterase class I)
MAFQPIVDVEAGQVYAYEALVRGEKGEPAGWVLEQVHPETMYAFDQLCRVRALEHASRLKLADSGARLSINFFPGAVYSAEACLRLTLGTADALGFPKDRLIFEITENERVRDRKHIQSIVEAYRKHGFLMALDDFGAGYSGLNLLADLSADLLKLDMDLIRNIDTRPAARQIVRAVHLLCRELGVGLIAEGVETEAEFWTLRECGVSLMQGYLLARPAFELLPGFQLPERGAAL